VNRDDVDAEGAEGEFKITPIERLSLRVHYTYVDTKVAATGAPLRQRPKHRAGFSAYYGLTEAIQFSWNTEYVRRIFDSSIPTGDLFLPSYSKTDVGVSYKYKWLTAAFNIDNLFDKKYQQFVGFENPGRRARISLSANF
jgi:vitamin B12 transporter